MKRFIFFITTIVFMHTSTSAQKSRSFILVHANWHGAWSWNKLQPILQSKGYHVKSFDLPGHGADSTSPALVSLDDCVQKLVSIASQEKGPVFLLGHSSAGIIISQAAEILGREKVTALIYLDAFIPQDGESVLSLADKYTTEPTPLSRQFIVSPDKKTITLDIPKATALLYHDCGAETIAYAVEHLRPGPIAVLSTPVHLTTNRYGTIPKYYILCTDAKDMDKTAMSKNVPCEKIYQLNSSHSPFFSMPEKLAEILQDIASR